MEFSLGIQIPGFSPVISSISTSSNFTATLGQVANASTINSEVQSAVEAAIPILIEIAIEFGFQSTLSLSLGAPQFAHIPTRDPLTTKCVLIKFMHVRCDGRIAGTDKHERLMFLASWISIGKTTILPTRQMPRSDLKGTIIICIIREFSLPSLAEVFLDCIC